MSYRDRTWHEQGFTEAHEEGGSGGEGKEYDGSLKCHRADEGVGKNVLKCATVPRFGVGSVAHSASAQSRQNSVGECVVCMTGQAVTARLPCGHEV